MVLPAVAVIVNYLGDVFLRTDKGSYLHLKVINEELCHSITGLCLILSVYLSHSEIHIRHLSLLAVLASTVLDIDHFIEAGSFNINDVTSLKHRPFLHNSLLVAGILLFFWVCLELRTLYSQRSYHSLPTVALIHNNSALVRRPYIPYMVTITICVIGHHARDATRRGFWFGPWSTSKIDYFQLSVIFYTMVIFGCLVEKLLSPPKERSRPTYCV